MRQNLALAKWRRGEPSIGGWLQLPTTHSAELMAHAGFDWLCIDLQHGMVEPVDLARMLPAISTTDTTPLVRVTQNDPGQIMRALDLGAMGVIVPLVNTRAQAEAAIAACRYPPVGMRSFGPIRAALYGGRGYATEANDQIACIVMIETAEALEHLEAIVSTPGLDAVYIGPADLALSLGLPAQGDTDHPRHVETVQHIRSVCKNHNVPCGIHTAGLDYTRRRLAMGFDFVTLGGDVGFMMRMANAELAAAKEAAAART
jgi:4-hydroxy-2-oxoheptanedioate aldolase